MAAQASLAALSPSALSFPAVGGQAGPVRRWVRAAVLRYAGAATADSAEVAVAELFANAMQHSRSGKPGGTVLVIVACGPGGVSVHVHDQGAAHGAVPRPRDAGHDAEDGRGLRIVDSLTDKWGSQPTVTCSYAGAGHSGPGRCTWFAYRLAKPSPGGAGTAVGS